MKLKLLAVAALGLATSMSHADSFDKAAKTVAKGRVPHLLQIDKKTGATELFRAAGLDVNEVKALAKEGTKDIAREDFLAAAVEKYAKKENSLGAGEKITEGQLAKLNPSDQDAPQSAYYSYYRGGYYYPGVIYINYPYYPVYYQPWQYTTYYYVVYYY